MIKREFISPRDLEKGMTILDGGIKVSRIEHDVCGGDKIHINDVVCFDGVSTIVVEINK